LKTRTAASPRCRAAGRAARGAQRRTRPHSISAEGICGARGRSAQQRRGRHRAISGSTVYRARAAATARPAAIASARVASVRRSTFGTSPIALPSTSSAAARSAIARSAAARRSMPAAAAKGRAEPARRSAPARTAFRSGGGVLSVIRGSGSSTTATERCDGVRRECVRFLSAAPRRARWCVLLLAARRCSRDARARGAVWSTHGPDGGDVTALADRVERARHRLCRHLVRRCLRSRDGGLSWSRRAPGSATR
jgi:hypothetical protein